jgi:hypothetical protein
MPSIVSRIGGGALVALGLVVLLAAVESLRRLTPLPENADVPGGFALLFLALLALVGLGLFAVGTAVLGSGADWVGRRARSVFRAAGYLVAGSLPVAALSVPITGRIEVGVLVVLGAILLGVLAVVLGLEVGVVTAAYRSVSG